MSAIEYKSWDEVKACLAAKPALQAALTKLADTQKGSKKKPVAQKQFVSVKYRFGDLLVDQGEFRLPAGTSAEEIKKVKKHLGLQENVPSIPLGFVAKNVLEAGVRVPTIGSDKLPADYKSLGYEVIPQAILKPGEPFGLFEFLDARCSLGRSPKYDVSAGSRSTLLTINLSTEKSRELISNAFPSAQVAKDEAACFTNGEVPASELIRKCLPNDDYAVEVILFPSNLVNGAARLSPDQKEFVRVTFEEAWRQSSHLRNGFLEIIKPKDFLDFVRSSTGLPPDYFDSLSRLVHGVLWIRNSQIPGYKICAGTEGDSSDGSVASSGPFVKFIKGLNQVFAKHKPPYHFLLFYPEYYSQNSATPLYLPSRIDFAKRSYKGKQAKTQDLLVEGFKKCKEQLQLASNVNLLFGSTLGSDLQAVGFPNQTSAKLYLGHKLFCSGFAKIP